jgi:hypothetical protein
VTRKAEGGQGENFRLPLGGTPLLLHGLQVLQQKPDLALGHNLTQQATSSDLLQTLPPDWHLPLAMRRYPGASVDVRGDLGSWEMSPAPLGDACEIGWGWLEGGRGWPVAAALHPMASTTVPDKVLVSHPHCLLWGRLRLRRERHRQQQPPPDDETTPIVLHIYLLCISMARALHDLCNAAHPRCPFG